jgi:hypothetical protein
VPADVTAARTAPCPWSGLVDAMVEAVPLVPCRIYYSITGCRCVAEEEMPVKPFHSYFTDAVQAEGLVEV